MSEYIKYCTQFESYSLEELEEAIIELYQKSDIIGFHSRNSFNPLRKMLLERKYRMDTAFVWTDESVARIVRLNKKIQDCLNNLKDEAIKTHQVLTTRLKDEKETFFTDFKIEVQLTPFVSSVDKEGNTEEDSGIYEVLCEQIQRGINLSFEYDGIDSDINIKPLYFDYSLNWNIDTPLCFGMQKFENIYIGYAIHELNDHCCWSVNDILCINEIWGELIVTQQHFEETI